MEEQAEQEVEEGEEVLYVYCPRINFRNVFTGGRVSVFLLASFAKQRLPSKLVMGQDVVVVAIGWGYNNHQSLYNSCFKTNLRIKKPGNCTSPGNLSVE